MNVTNKQTSADHYVERSFNVKCENVALTTMKNMAKK